MAAVETKHPDYTDRATEWAMMRHAARGAQAVAAEGETYLPMPSGFRAQDDQGKAMYRAYATRAQFPDILAPTLRGMVGVIHRTEAQIEGLDEAGLAFLWERATKDSLTLEALHRRITGELLLMGRYGLLVDAPEGGGDPYLAGYSTEALINWSAERDFFVLDESGRERQDFEWKDVKRHRVLRLEGGRYSVSVHEGAEGAEKVLEPRRRGGGALDFIPFVVIGARDLSVAPDEPPLIGVARSSLALYRLDADYRHQLFMSGQETLFIFNGELPRDAAVGAGVCHSLKGHEEQTPDARYVGPSGVGIAAHRVAIQDEREAAVAAGARVFDGVKREAESGEALRLRYAAQTATLTSVALASAAGLEKALRFAALMVGAAPEKIVVKPNLSFVDATMTPSEAKDLVAVWQSGAIAKRTLYENLQRGEIASAERSFEDEEEMIEGEGPALGEIALPAGL